MNLKRGKERWCPFLEDKFADVDIVGRPCQCKTNRFPSLSLSLKITNTLSTWLLIVPFKINIIIGVKCHASGLVGKNLLLEIKAGLEKLIYTLMPIFITNISLTNFYSNAGAPDELNLHWKKNCKLNPIMSANYIKIMVTVLWNA